MKNNSRGSAARVWLVIATLLAALSVVRAWRLTNGRAGIDFFQFWAGAQIAPQVSNMYSPDVRAERYTPFVQQAWARDHSERLVQAASARTSFEFYSTPFLYASFLPYPASYDAALDAYRFMTLIAGALAIILIARTLAQSWTIAMLLVVFAMVLFGPVQTDLAVANVNLLQLLTIAIAMWLAGGEPTSSNLARSCDFGAGAILAMAAAFKPNAGAAIALLVLYHLISNRRTRALWEVIGAAAGGVLAFITGALLFRHAGAWFEWMAAARELSEELIPIKRGNLAPALPLAEAWGPRVTMIIAGTLIATIVVLLLRRRGRGDDRSPAIIALALLVYLASATLVWTHYFVLALPTGIALIADRVSVARRVAGLAGLALVGHNLFGLLGFSQAERTPLIVWTGLFVLVVTALWQIGDTRVSS